MGGPPRHDFGKGLVYPSQNVLVNLPHSAGQGAFIITGKGPEVAAYPDDFRMCPTKLNIPRGPHRRAEQIRRKLHSAGWRQTMSIWLQWIVCQSWHAWVAGLPANLGDQQTHRGKQIQKPPVSPNPFTLVDHHNNSTRVPHPRRSNLAGHARDPFELFHSHPPPRTPGLHMIVTCTTGAWRIKRTRFVGSTNAQSCATSL
jgi:hypothetical protein